MIFLEIQVNNSPIKGEEFILYEEKAKLENDNHDDYIPWEE